MTNESKSTHTPGPWTVDADRAGTSLVISGSENEVIALLEVTDDDAAFDFDQAANARLVAAAPELLAALRDAEKFCPVPMQDRIRAVIAKAEGQ